MMNNGGRGYEVYWEKQGTDKLCAVHTLNTLMQSNAFSEVELAQIAHQLDQHEQALMGGGSGSLAAGSGVGESFNVDADGNFSLPVMETALQRFEMCLVNIEKPEVKSKIMSNPQSEEAYICNSHRRAHWYCLRKVFAKWYDLDSLKPAPQFVSDFNLTAFLEATLRDGFTVFVVRPVPGSNRSAISLPQPDKFLTQQLQSHQFFLTDKDMEKMRDEYLAKEQKEMQDAQKEGGGDDSGKPAFTMVVPADKRKVETDWSKLGGGNTLSGGGGGASSSAPIVVDDDMDDDMKAAIAASLGDIQCPEPPAEPSEGLTIQFRFKSEPPLKRIFAKDATMLSVFQFLEHANLKQGAFSSVGATPLVSMERYSVLKQGFPKKEKFIRCLLDGQVYLEGENVTASTLTSRQFAKQEAMIVQME
ncbi:unnamed protein product [Amoebophrya sp. A25]|nr:unnamed protein product [Amoebophrya sp. A25]|eukprot:GSA25T00003421001.1